MRLIKRMTIFIAMICLLLCSTGIVGHAEDSAKYLLYTKNNLYEWKTDGALWKYYDCINKEKKIGVEEEANIIFRSETSSNAAVMNIYTSSYVNWDFEPCGIKYYIVRKPGTATIAYDRIKLPEKDTTREKEEFVITQYVNPIKSIKIGKKELASKLNKEPFAAYYGAMKGKLVVIPQKGWKLGKMHSVWNERYGEYEKLVKNNSYMNLTNSTNLLEIQLINTKTKQKMNVVIGDVNHYHLIADDDIFD